MTILLAVVSVLGITALAWAARRLLAAPVCPICAGVAGTWLWMLAGRELGYAADATVLAILLGATVAGSAYQLEKRLPPGRSRLLWDRSRCRLRPRGAGVDRRRSGDRRADRADGRVPRAEARPGAGQRENRGA